MNKNIWTRIHRFCQIGWLCSIIFLFLFVGIRETSAVTYATSLKHRPTLIPTPTSTPIATPIPTLTPVPKPTLTPVPTATPIATATPEPTLTSLPTATPTAIQLPKPTPTPHVQVPPSPMFPASKMVLGTPAVATPTSTPESVVAGVVTTTSATTTGASSNQQLQDGADKNTNLFLLPFGIGIPLFLFSGGMLLLLWRRMMNEPKPALQTISHNTQAYPWTNRREKLPILKFPQLISFGALAARVAAFGRTQTSSIRMLLSELAHTSSNFHPITTNFPEQMLTMLSDAATTATYPQNGHAQPSPTHILNLPLKETRVREPNENKQMPASPALAKVGMGKLNLPMLPLPVTPPIPLSAIQPPLINDDPILEEIAWQAQTGLFVLLGREKAS